MKKFAVLSDIHSNSIALKAILSDISNKNINKIYNLGDTLYGPIDPLGTYEILKSYSIINHIMGNGDRLLLENISEEDTTMNRVRTMLTEEIKTWLRLQPKVIKNQNSFFCHGTPYADDEYLLEKIEKNRVMLKSDIELSDLLKSIPQNFIFCGHSHISRTIYLNTIHGEKIIINPGSVGLPAYKDDLPLPHKMEANNPLAKYTIVNLINDTTYNIEHIEIGYDYNHAAKLAIENGRPDWARALLTGKV